ncbi:DnaJ-related protein rsp1 like [Verticillium longisporum]|uniref:DnaJ-related protein rsp1 like n=1 Tax=Verticillium longisporum TaxID=100787 RepID=A0A8I2ZJN4_VERLO|nr:DnaJ-related protein rsp1 like [Verticillium longisporum]
MPKLDNSRDYYADLDLPVTADVNDIKKQFRKLALRYHPDRNPGREAEVNSKFQVIQSAHEILTDPEQKAKYDASRGRSRYPTASGVRGNPWQDAGANFPPPPRRNQPTRNATQSGANKYRNFTSGAAPTAKTQPREDPMESRRNAWQAFEQMRPSSQGKSAASQAKPRPVPEQPVPPPRPAQRPERPVPRTPAQKQRAEAAFGAKKSSGYAPHSPVPGDEPSVSSSAYATNRHTYDASGSAAQQQRDSIPDPLAPFRDKFGDSRQRTPYSSGGGEKTNPFDGISVGRTKSTRESTRHSEYQDAGLSPGGARPRSSSPPRTAHMEDPSGAQQSHTANTASDTHKRSFASRASAKYTPSGRAHETGEAGGSRPTTAAANEAQPNASTSSNKANGPSIFNFVVDDDTFTRTTPEQKRFARSSADDINTSFVDEQGADTWQFSAGSPHTPQQEDPFAKRRTQSASRTGWNSPLKRPPPRPAKEPLPAENEKTAEEVRFDAEGWSQKIGPQNFAHQPTQNKASSPTRPSRSNSRKPKSVHPTVGSAGLVNEESSSNEDTDGGARQPEPEPATTGSPMPMDIDPETPPPNPRSAPPSRRDSARNIPVEPSRPEWRPGNVQPVPETSQPNGVKRAPFNPNTAGSEDSEDFRASFADLKNVAPFATKPTGLNSFGDLKSQLPFESRASERIPIEKEKKQEPELNFPSIPRAPTPPAALAVSGLKPSLTTWQKYLVEFQDYLQQWDAFNAQITYHFETRKAQILEERGTAGYAFLTTQGDEGVEEYLSWVRQDKEVRRKWSLACDEHEMRMLDFLKYKKLMR